MRKIARAAYGDESQWRLIARANRDATGGDPNNIRPGMVLKIPAKP